MAEIDFETKGKGEVVIVRSATASLAFRGPNR